MLKDLSPELQLAQLDELALPPSFGDGTSIAAQIAQLCTGAFADFCSIYLRKSGPAPAAFATTDPARYDGLRELPYDEFLRDRATKLGIGALIEEPLMASDRIIGMLVFGMEATDTMTVVNRRVISIVSSILSTAVEQAEQLSHHYRVSKRLQKAMLPATLATTESMSFDAAYQPASAEADVGGDWYDAFEVFDGTICVSVGDVTGHGLEAAVAMSEFRRAIRSAAMTTDSPSELLNHVDSIVSSQGIGMATAVVGLYDVHTSVFRYACSGHPHPVLITPSGRALFLPGGGLLLGLGTASASADWTVTLSPGTTCFLYTDGLLEYNRDVIAGERALLRALEDMAVAGKRTAAALHEQIFRDGAVNTDDCATLALHHIEQPAGIALHLEYSAIPLSAAMAREAVRHFLAGFAFTAEQVYELLAAIGEAIANAIEHGAQEAGSTFIIEGRIDDKQLAIFVDSAGHWRAFTPRDERGRGIPIMRSCAKSLEISSTHNRTRVTLTFDLP